MVYASLPTMMNFVDHYKASKMQTWAFALAMQSQQFQTLFTKWLNILYVSLKFLIQWPTKEKVQDTLPEFFQPLFQNAVVIIDCTEVFIERATNLLARSQT